MLCNYDEFFHNFALTAAHFGDSPSEKAWKGSVCIDIPGKRCLQWICLAEKHELFFYFRLGVCTQFATPCWCTFLKEFSPLVIQDLPLLRHHSGTFLYGLRDITLPYFHRTRQARCGGHHTSSAASGPPPLRSSCLWGTPCWTARPCP